MFESTVYSKRRQALRDKVGNGLILILGNNEAPANYPDNTYKFRQDSSFLYFSDMPIRDMQEYLMQIPAKITFSAMTSRWTISSGWVPNPA